MSYNFLEALEAGLPIITTDVGGSESCVIPYQTGMIMPADAAALAAEIIRLANDPNLRDGMSIAARVRAQNFGILQMLESVMAVYTDALGA